jgi:hypothetical protein
LEGTKSIRQRRKILKELIKLYEDCPKRVTTYVRWRWITQFSGTIFLVVAVLIPLPENVHALKSVGLAFLAGILAAYAAWLKQAAIAWALVVRFSTFRGDEAKRNLQELEDGG